MRRKNRLLEILNYRYHIGSEASSLCKLHFAIFGLLKYNLCSYVVKKSLIHNKCELSIVKSMF